MHPIPWSGPRVPRKVQGPQKDPWISLHQQDVLPTKPIICHSNRRIQSLTSGNKSIEKSLSVPIDVVWFRLRLFMSSDFCTWTLEGAVSWGKNPSATIVRRLQLEQITMLSNQNYSFFEELQNPSYYELPLVLFTWNAMWQFQQKNTHPLGVVLDTNDHFDGRCLEGEMSKNLWMFDSQHPYSGIRKII